MRKLTYLLSLVIMTSLLLTGCKDKDDEKDDIKPVGENYIRVNNTSYPLVAGILELYESEPDFHEGNHFGITLYSAGLTPTENDGLSGTGNSINFDVFSTSSTAISDGDYTYFDPSDDVVPVDTHIGMFYLLNYNMDEMDWDDLIYTENGTLTVSRTGNNYSISFSGVDENDNNISVNYNGTLTYVDSSNN